ncbi:MAG TPA: sensor histidine kinase [Terriglobia bacterium]|nr:sensor histidine kinase [Terriglobia bacterium]
MQPKVALENEQVDNVGELSASIAHEVNQSLAAVINNINACLRWLNRNQPELEEARAAAARAVRDATRATEVVARIRSLIGKSPLQLSLLDINDLVREVLVQVGDQILKNDLSLRTDLDTSLQPTKGDGVQLHLVIVNLIMNAIEATPVKSGFYRELVVSTKNHGEAIVVSVCDSGVGIDPDKVEEIFSPFFTTKPGGMGMGLSISRSILRSHGGRLWATQNTDRGTTFSFSLPAG